MNKKDLIIRNERISELVNKINRQGGMADTIDALNIYNLYSDVHKNMSSVRSIEDDELRLIYMLEKIKEVVI